MENSSQLLDHGLIGESKTVNIEANLASGGKRFANYLIDVVVLIVLMILVIFFLGGIGALESEAGLNLLIYPIMILYYAIMESTTGKTIGKMITGTKVVDMEGRNISFGQALGRALCRFIPFEAFSFLGSSAVGWHDSIPKTRVING